MIKKPKPRIEDEPNNEKKCHKCDKFFPKTSEFFRFEFRKDRNGKGGFCSPCRVCANKRRVNNWPEHYKKNREKIIKANIHWKANNREKARQWFRDDYRTPKGRYRHAISIAKTRGIEFKLTLDQYKDFWKQDCFYCRLQVQNIGLDRLDSNIGYLNIGYLIDNIVSCCGRCNQAKNTMSVDEFISHCELIVDHFNQKRLKLVETK